VVLEPDLAPRAGEEEGTGDGESDERYCKT
jgi:hypothetical protein